MNIEEIPLPPEASAGEIEGRYEIELDAATNGILSELKKHYGETREKILFLPAETGAAKIFEFYDRKFSEKGIFANEAGAPVNHGNYQQKTWRNEGWLSGQTIAVAVIDPGKDAEGKPIKFLAVYLTEK